MNIGDKINKTRWVALMIQLGKLVGGVGWLAPTTYIQLTGAGSTAYWGWIKNVIPTMLGID